jgi:hypothetical protein
MSDWRPQGFHHYAATIQELDAPEFSGDTPSAAFSAALGWIEAHHPSNVPHRKTITVRSVDEQGRELGRTSGRFMCGPELRTARWRYEKSKLTSKFQVYVRGGTIYEWDSNQPATIQQLAEDCFMVSFEGHFTSYVATRKSLERIGYLGSQ